MYPSQAVRVFVEDRGSLSVVGRGRERRAMTATVDAAGDDDALAARAQQRELKKQN